MITWIRTGRTVNTEGTTITYAGLGTTMLIQSRKRHIPHANGVGTWDHTTYWVMNGSKDIKQQYALRDAKDWAEKYWEEINR